MFRLAGLVTLVGLVCLACSGTQPAPSSTPTPAAAAKPTSAPVAASPVPSVAAAAAPSPSPTAAPTRAPAAAVSPSPAATTAAVPVTASRVDTLTAANVAFARGDTAGAADLYQRVVNTPPSAGESADVSSTLNDFARFRALASLLAARKESDAREQLDQLQRNPNTPFARLAAQLWDQYSMTGQLRAACAQLQPQIASQAGPTLAALQAAGVTGVGPTTLCAPP